LFLDDTRIDFTNKFSYVFWCGDLNYRLGPLSSFPLSSPFSFLFLSLFLFSIAYIFMIALPFETVVDTIYNGHELELLHKADQLKNEMHGTLSPPLLFASFFPFLISSLKLVLSCFV
jgi:hypothetical protein